MIGKFSKHKIFLISIVILASSLGFIWGFLSHREKIFPYRFARHLATSIGIVPKEPFKRKMVQSRPTNTETLLESLGYVESTFDSEHINRGVVNINQEKVFESYRFYNSRSAQQAFLIDIFGNIVHTWRFDTLENWQGSTLVPNGDVLVIIKNHEILRIDKNSNLIWRKSFGVHHDLDVFQDHIYVLTRRPGREMAPLYSAPFLEDMVSVLSSSGQFVREFSLFDLIWNSEYRFLLTSVHAMELSESQILDVLHCNHVEVIDGSDSHQNPIFSEGNILVCMRNINTVMIFDPKAESIVWLWGPNNLTFPHHPSVVDAGNIMVFDNGTEKSRVIEIDPISGEIEWLYEDAGFFSEWRGSAQRLPNGNTLITESDTGYVFEVTETGEEVWRYANPDVKPNGKRGAIWRMTAFERDDVSFLEK